MQNTIREIEQYQQKWLQSPIMDRNRTAKQALQYSTYREEKYRNFSICEQFKDKVKAQKQVFTT